MTNPAYDHLDADFDGIESYGSELPSKRAVHGMLTLIALIIFLIGVAVYRIV